MKNRNYLWLLFGIIALIAATHFVDSNVSEQQPAVKTEVIRQQSDALVQHYEAEIACLEQRSDSLLQQVNSSKQQLAKAKKNSRVLELKMKQLAADMLAATDTSQKLAYSDSLESETGAFMEVAAEKDSLCEQVVEELTELSVQKDDAFNLCQQSLLSLKGNLNASLTEQQRLQGELSLSEKRNKRKKIQNRMLASGILVLSGITTTLFIQQHP